MKLFPTLYQTVLLYPIIKDQEGGIWIGTYGGINYISPKC